jgi:hypothetical protein
MPDESAGLTIERRAFIAVPACAALGILARFRGELAAQDKPQTITFDTFVEEAGAQARKLIADGGRGEGDYLHHIAALAERIDRVPDTPLGEPFKGLIRSGMNYRGSGIVVVQWSMEKGLTYPPHNHPNYNGITLGIEGECRIRNFDVVGGLPEMATDARFRVRETQSALMTPGRVVSMMATNRDNIHTLHTYSKAVRGIDVMALVGKHVGFSFVNIDDRRKNDEGVYDAAWGEYLGR